MEIGSRIPYGNPYNKKLIARSPYAEIKKRGLYMQLPLDNKRITKMKRGALKPSLVEPLLGLFDYFSVSDGKATEIITRADPDKNYQDDFILIKGFGLSMGHYQAQTYDDWDFLHSEEKMKKVYVQLQGKTDHRQLKNTQISVVKGTGGTLIYSNKTPVTILAIIANICFNMGIKIDNKIKNLTKIKRTSIGVSWGGQA